jgi:hypothetical protein
MSIHNFTKNKIYLILCIPLFISLFVIGYEQTQVYASSADNVTSNPGTTEIILSDLNGTKVFTSNLRGDIPCYYGMDGECYPNWDPPHLQMFLMMNVTMEDPNGTQVISFENIQLECNPPLGSPGAEAHCVQK